MSKLTELLKKANVFNAHGFATTHNPHSEVFIEYSAGETGRASRTAAWRVYRIGFQTDPETHWMNYGNKTFFIQGEGPHSELKTSIFEEARAWAEERYGISEWARTPYGSWMEASFVKARLEKLKLIAEKGYAKGKV